MLCCLLLLLFAAFPTLAQDNSIYEDPAGHFSAEIPTGWNDESTEAYAHFARSNVDLYLLAVEADDAQAAISAALDMTAPDLDAEPVQSNELPTSNGLWTQNVYLREGDAFTVALVQVNGQAAYVMVIEAPGEAAFQDVNADINEILASFTFRDSLDLTTVQPAELTADMLADLEAYMTGAMERFDIPGAAVTVVQNGEVVYSNGFGVIERGGDQPVTPETLFMIGSVTKSMTTLMMATLVDDGILDWDAPVTEILPSFALSDPRATPQIRVRDLVNMSSGVPRYDIVMALQTLDPDEMIESLADIPMVAQPGERYNYSNQMVAAGGFIAALAAGGEYGATLDDTYAELMQTRVFDPIGMSSTTLDLEAAAADDDHAMPHTWDPATGNLFAISLDGERYYIPQAPAGAVWSNVEDMARYMLTEFGQGVAPDGIRVVSAENLLVTQTPAISMGGGKSYGMGWTIGEYHGLRLVDHGGATMGFSSEFAFLPDARLGVIILTNRNLAHDFGFAVREYVFELAFGLEHEADALYLASSDQVNQLVEQLVSRVNPVTLDAADVADFVGSYEHGAQITFRDGRLMLTVAIGEFPLLPTHEEGVFIASGAIAGNQFTFHRISSDDVRLTVSSPGDATQVLTVRRIA
jgi:CubicO group peptidase (beta-lactamase class C family)